MHVAAVVALAGHDGHVRTEQGGQRIWIVGYGGPPDGFVILTDKSGIATSSVAIGLPESWTVKRIESDAPVLIVEAVTGTGTGVRQDDFHVISIKGGQLRLLWKGLSYRRDMPPGSGRSVESRYALRVDTDNERHELILHRIPIASAARGETVIVPLPR